MMERGKAISTISEGGGCGGGEEVNVFRSDVMQG